MKIKSIAAICKKNKNIAIFERYSDDGRAHSGAGRRWDILIAHPPCTYLTNAGAVRMRVKGEVQPERLRKAMEAKDFFLEFLNAKCARICVENPTPMKIVGLPPYTQIIQPYQFGHPAKTRSKTFPGIAAAMASQWGTEINF